MSILTIAHDRFRRSSLRFLETEDNLKVGMFICLQDETEEAVYHEKEFLIIETAPTASWNGIHTHLVLYPLGVCAEQQKVYSLVPKVKA